MNKAMLKTMATIAAVAAFMLPSASRIAMAPGAAPSAARAGASDGRARHPELHAGFDRSR